MKFEDECSLTILTLISIILLLVGALFNNNYFSNFFLYLSIAVLTIMGAFFIYLKQKDDNIKKKEDHFKSKLTNLLTEFDHNIDLPQKYENYFEKFKQKLIKNKKANKIIKEFNLKNKNAEEFISKFIQEYLCILNNKKKFLNQLDVYEELLQNKEIKGVLIKRPIITIDVDDRILLDCISELEYYKKYNKLLKKLNEVFHSTKVFKTNQKILLYSTEIGGFNELEIFNSLICHMEGASLFRKRIKKATKLILNINKNIDIEEYNHIKKEFD